MALQTLKALWASGDKFPITTLTFNLTLGFKYNGQPWQGSSVENKILRYALSQSDVTLDGEVYSASCFSAALPERSDNTFQDLTFSIGDVNREILQYLSRITRNDHKNLNFVTLAQWHPTTLQKEFEIEMVINSVNFSGSAANFTASFADLVNTEFPQKRYTAENAPGIIYVSINIDKYLLARYKQGGRTLPDVDCYGLVLEFFKNELKINLPLEQSITDISQAPEGEKNFKKIVKYAEVTEKNLERDKIYLCGFYTKNNFLAHCGIVINNKILHINKNGAVLQSVGTIKRIYSLWSLKFYEITRNCRT